MTFYGDLDVSIIRERPAGRGAIVTALRDESKLPAIIEFLRGEIAALMQAADDLYENSVVSDATWAVLSKKYSTEQLMDVVFTIGQYSFQPAAKTLESNDGNKVRLTDKETSILKYLYRQGPKTISRDILLKEVWGYNNRVTTHTLETHIYRLRQKIERDPSNAEILVTESGGYKLVP